MKISSKKPQVTRSSLVRKGHIQVEQGLTEFSGWVPRAHSCLTLAGWALPAGRMHVCNGTGAVWKSQSLRCWDPGCGATTTISDPLAFFKGQQQFNTWGQRSWERDWGNLLCSIYGSLLSRWKLLMRPKKWNLKRIRHGNWAPGCGTEMCPTFPEVRFWTYPAEEAEGWLGAAATQLLMARAPFLHRHFNQKRRK